MIEAAAGLAWARGRGRGMVIAAGMIEAPY